jgi:hypothetical protein
MNTSTCRFLIVLLAWLMGPVLNSSAQAQTSRVPGRPRPIAPEAGASIPFTNRLDFIWTQANRALKYTVFVGKDGTTFTNQTVWGAEHTNLVVETQFRAGDYTWMVLARNTNGAGPWSTTVTFRVEERMMSPGGWERLAETSSPVFHWESTPGATVYKVRLAVYKAPDDALNLTNANGRYRTLYEGSAIRDGEGNWAPTGVVFKPAAYRWEVREKVGGVWAPWSESSYFRIDVPSPVHPVAPKRGALTSNRPTFKWAAGPKPPSIYFQIRIWKYGRVLNTYTGMDVSPFETPAGYEMPGTGNMSWQIRAFEYFPGDIQRFGPWSEAIPFTVK